MAHVSTSLRGAQHAPNRDRGDSTGNLPVGRFNSGAGAGSGTFWRGDMVWAVPAGGGGSSVSTATAVAGEALGGHRAVYVADDAKAYYADNTLDVCRRTVGITTGAASLGATATVQVGGVIELAGWAWTGNSPVWLTTLGQLVQSVPGSNYLFQVGIPLGPTRLRIDPLLVAKI